MWGSMRRERPGRGGDVRVNTNKNTAKTEILGQLQDGRPYRITEFGMIRISGNRSLSLSTQEGVPIIVVYVSNLPDRVTYYDLRYIFSRFGHVLDCYIRFDPLDRLNPIYAFVTFSNPQEALRARLSQIIIGSKKLKITSADSWHQERKNDQKLRELRKTVSHQNQTEATDSDSENTSETDENLLTILNEDCLLKILSYLPLNELIRSERTCKRWKYLVQQRFKSIGKFETKKWTNNIPLTTSIFQKLLMKFGRYLRILYLNQDWSYFTERTPYLIGKHCPNLTKLVVISLDSKQWKGIISRCTQLKSLTFESCSDVTDDTFRYCSANLEELILKDASRVTGKFLLNINLEKLKKLSIFHVYLRDCFLIESFKRMKELRQLAFGDILFVSQTFIKDALEVLPNLENLSLSYLDINKEDYLYPITELKHLEVLRLQMNSGLTDYLISKICKSCVNLAVLDISVKPSIREWIRGGVTNKSFTHIWKLKCLKALNVSGLDITDIAFSNIGVNDNGVKLEELIIRYNKNITDSTVINVVKSCPNLQKLDIFSCSNIERNIVETVREISNLFYPARCLHLNVSMDSARMPTKVVGSNLCVSYEGFDPVFLFGSFDISDDELSDDEEVYSIDLDDDEISLFSI